MPNDYYATSRRAIVFAAAILLLWGRASAQVQAPVPSDFASAQTVFIANAGFPAVGAQEKVAVSLMYNSFYQKFNAWNKYKIVASPKDADLAFELSIHDFVGSVSFGSSSASSYIRLDARDVKTHTLLWTVDDPIDAAFREKTFRRNVAQAVELVITDLKSLAAGKQPGSASDTTPTTQP